MPDETSRPRRRPGRLTTKRPEAARPRGAEGHGANVPKNQDSTEDRIIALVAEKLDSLGRGARHEDRKQTALARLVTAMREGKTFDHPDRYAVRSYKNLEADEHREKKRERRVPASRAVKTPWASVEALREAALHAARAEAAARGWPARWWFSLSILEALPTQEEERRRARARKTFREKEIAHKLRCPPGSRESHSPADEPAWGEWIDSPRVLGSNDCKIRLGVAENRHVGRRRQIVEDIATIIPWAMSPDERAPAGRDLGLAAIIAGDFPKVPDWRRATVPQVLRAMTKAMLRAHASAGPYVTPLAPDEKNRPRQKSMHPARRLIGHGTIKPPSNAPRPAT
jgi:hypothetical protein